MSPRLSSQKCACARSGARKARGAGSYACLPSTTRSSKLFSSRVFISSKSRRRGAASVAQFKHLPKRGNSTSGNCRKGSDTAHAVPDRRRRPVPWAIRIRSISRTRRPAPCDRRTSARKAVRHSICGTTPYCHGLHETTSGGSARCRPFLVAVDGPGRIDPVCINDFTVRVFNRKTVS